MESRTGVSRLIIMICSSLRRLRRDSVEIPKQSPSSGWRLLCLSFDYAANERRLRSGRLAMTTGKENKKRLENPGRRIKTRLSLNRTKIPKTNCVFGTYVKSDSQRAYILLLSRLLLSAPEFHRILRSCARGLYRRSGITPCPEG